VRSSEDISQEEERRTPVIMMRWMLFNSFNFLKRRLSLFFTERRTLVVADLVRSRDLTALPFVDDNNLLNRLVINSKHCNSTRLPSRLIFEHGGKFFGVHEGFVCGDKHVEFGIGEPLLFFTVAELEVNDHISSFGLAIERNDPEIGRPSFEFSDPVCDRRVGDNNKGRGSFEILNNFANERCDLNSLALRLRFWLYILH
jgi:hypothetical protein